MDPINLGSIDLCTIDLSKGLINGIDFSGGKSTWKRGPDYLATDFNTDFRIQATS